MTNETQQDNKPFFSLTWGGRGPKPDPEIEDTARAHPDLPPLVLLSDDAAGPSVRRLTCFPDAAAASGHIDFWYPPEHRDRLIAFWALSRKPAERDDGAVEAEALVLVRDHRDPELVSPFSFTEMSDAHDFIRQEMSRGLDPSLVVLLWAVPATVETTVFGDVRVNPDRAPELEQTMRILWNERCGRPAVAGSPRPSETARPRSQVEALLSDLANALRTGNSDEPRPAFAGFGSPEGRF
jgi:hypothetical protein